MSLDLRVAPFESNPLMQWALETVKAAIPRGYEAISLRAYEGDLRVEAQVHALNSAGDEVGSRTLSLEGEVWQAAFLLLSAQLVIDGVLRSRFANKEVGHEAYEAETRLANEPWQAAGIDTNYTPARDGLGIEIIISR
jgi:hypothetical protein